jgi:hypothetical protein
MPAPNGLASGRRRPPPSSIDTRDSSDTLSVSSLGDSLVSLSISTTEEGSGRSLSYPSMLAHRPSLDNPGTWHPAIARYLLSHNFSGPDDAEIIDSLLLLANDIGKDIYITLAKRAGLSSNEADFILYLSTLN